MSISRPSGEPLLIDENLPRNLASLLRQNGYNAQDVRDVGLGGRPDRDVWQFAQTNSITIVTGDRDFANILAYPKPHAGIVLIFIPDRLRIATRNSLILAGLRRVAGRSLANCVVSISPTDTRIRP